MSEAPPNLVLDMLRAIRGDIAELKGDMVEVRQGLGLLETQLGHLVAHNETQHASLSVRLDRVSADVVLIKRRLDLVEA